MELWLALLVALLAAALALALGWLWARAGVEKARAELAARTAERDAARQALEELRASSEFLKNAFGDLSRRTLHEQMEAFLQLAQQKLGAVRSEAAADLEQRRQAIEQLLQPLREKLDQLKQATQDLEGKREKAYGSLEEQLKNLLTKAEDLGRSSQSLAVALRGSAQARGRWGEIALRNIAELAGMTSHCDFEEQAAAGDGTRPDMVVHLPGGGGIPVDAKTPLSAYLGAMEATDPEARRTLLQRHAQDLRVRVDELARKDYAAAVGGRVDFTVMFVPGDPILAAAFEHDPELQVDALRKRVLVATPVTLVALLRTVGIYWQQQAVAEDAQEVWDAARELYKRTATFQGHLENLGKGLERAVRSYWDARGSFERSVLPQGRRLEELGAAPEARRLEDLPEVAALPPAPADAP